MAKQHKIRPYARLLTMLGEQLIKNETIALTELIKNCYDADATSVKVIFDRFGENYEINKNSKIIIEDNGHGMTEKTILDHFLNPATPIKKNREKERTRLGRIVQGEKGIGRFAIFKLGRKITVTTHVINEIKENVVTFDFSNFDEDFSDTNKTKSLFLDELSVSVISRTPEIFTGQKLLKKNSNGTRIEIEGIKGKWNRTKIDKIIEDIHRLKPPKFFSNQDKKQKSDFDIKFYKGNEPLPSSDIEEQSVQTLLEDRAVFYIEGQFIDGKQRNYPHFSYTIKSSIRGREKSENRVLEIDDIAIKKLVIYKKLEKQGNINTHPECGPFDFRFYIFDFSQNENSKYYLVDEERKKLKSHRVYLYRDGVRVYPYGSPEDDWLQVDVMRGTISAGMAFSNDQVVGCVNITKKDNPKLQDKTNREGLIDSDNITNEFIGLLQIFLGYIRATDFQRFRAEIKTKQNTIKAQEIFKNKNVEESFQKAQKAVEANKPNALQLVQEVEKEYKKEREYLVQRAETTEHLAGVGLSVETTSHDIVLMMNNSLQLNDDLIRDTREEGVCKSLTTLRGMLSFIDSALKNIQQLFRSSRQKRKKIEVREILNKIVNIYKKHLERKKISFEIIPKEADGKSPLIAKTTDAVLLQVFINLFDNAIYWLEDYSQGNKRIEIRLDGNNSTLSFSDNGPGVAKDDIPYIFAPFYTSKGEGGRGLGLYIARQLLTKDDYSIYLAEKKSEKYLSGANFIIHFYSEEE